MDATVGGLGFSRFDTESNPMSLKNPLVPTKRSKFLD